MKQNGCMMGLFCGKTTISSALWLSKIEEYELLMQLCR